MTLLSIIGEDISRIIPVLNAYKEQIKHHILLCDDDPLNIERAKTLQKGMQKFSAKHTLGWFVRIISTNEDSAKAIKETAQKQFEYEGDLWLNATDGYPAITILLSEMVRQEGGKVLSYDHFDNDLHVIEPDGSMKTEKLQSSIDVQSYLTLLDYEILQITTKEDLARRKDHILALFEDIKLFRSLRKKLLMERQYGKRFKHKKYKKLLQHLLSLKVIGVDFRLKKSKESVLTGGLAEEYIFWLSESLKPDDIVMNTKIDFDDPKNEPEDQKRVINEFDILIAHNNRLFTIESKFSQRLDGLNFVYKYDAIIDYFGNASKAIIANISRTGKEPYIDTNASANFGHSTLRRARLAGVAIYHETDINAHQFQNLVKEFFNI